METQRKTVALEEWTLSVREPTGEGPYPVFVLLHGWTGDENSMWIFASRLPEGSLMIAPRGLHKSPMGGYSWHPRRERVYPTLEDLRPSINKLMDLLQPRNFPQADFSKMRMVGFSQGAALTYAFALMHPNRLQSFAGLSGFMPGEADDAIADRPLEDKPVFVTHGTQDELVDVEQARRSVELLERAGGRVTYCEDDVGHKLSLTCFKGLESFFEKH